MDDELIFMMGKFEARFPTDRLYSPSHLSFLKLEGEGHYRVAFTSYSVRLLQDVYFLEWSIDPKTTVKKKQEIGEIESSKALSTLYAPYDGVVLKFNEALLDDPSAINTDKYGDGWLFEFQTNAVCQEAEPAELLTPKQYLEVLEAGWEETQRTLKGQVN